MTYDLEDIISYLSQFALDKRVELMREKILNRTRYLSICVEDAFQPQNTSAILRSAEAFGVQDIHIIETTYKYNVNPDIALGSDKWVNMKKYPSTDRAIESLKTQGYRIVATIPQQNATDLEHFDFTKGKSAIFFGTELTGLSKYAINHADEYLYIPMYGFVESLNISVAAAITMYTLTTRLRNSTLNWQLAKNEQNIILLDWLKKSIRSSDMILQRFFEKHKNV
ncbi:MAG: RNA methyltransferase [Prevotellaceae bacterium]|jgi:tRNA (guanosine-2'-O-)-methyltransferase|nr:RNA methyltransferase [Prevotellaceae bacterium]